MMNFSAHELFEILNDQVECPWIDAKVREVGAIDNQTYRQMADCDTLKASTDLRMLKSYDLFASKGKGKATYYVPGAGLGTEPGAVITEPFGISTPPPEINTPPPEINTPPLVDLSTPPPEISTQPPVDLSTQPLEISTQPPVEISSQVLVQINELNVKKRIHHPEKIIEIIKILCSAKAMTSNEIAFLFGKREDYIRKKFLRKMIEKGELHYKFPEMINHPNQAYQTFNHP